MLGWWTRECSAIEKRAVTVHKSGDARGIRVQDLEEPGDPVSSVDRSRPLHDGIPGLPIWGGVKNQGVWWINHRPPVKVAPRRVERDEWGVLVEFRAPANQALYASVISAICVVGSVKRERCPRNTPPIAPDSVWVGRCKAGQGIPCLAGARGGGDSEKLEQNEAFEYVLWNPPYQMSASLRYSREPSTA